MAYNLRENRNAWPPTKPITISAVLDIWCSEAFHKTMLQ